LLSALIYRISVPRSLLETEALIESAIPRDRGDGDVRREIKGKRERSLLVEIAFHVSPKENVILGSKGALATFFERLSHFIVDGRLETRIFTAHVTLAKW
jgi:hypothetical protein